MRTARLVLLAGALVAAAGCTDFLEPEPETFIDPNNYFRTPTHMEQAVTGVYVRARNMFGNSWRLLGDLRGDLVTLQFNINVPGFTFQVDEFTEATNDNVVTAQYDLVFNTLSDANVVLSRLDGVTFTDERQKKRIQAEALFARSLAFWQALQFWGLGERWQPENLAVPLTLAEITHPDQAFLLQRATVQEVFDQIVEDLTRAKEALPRTIFTSGSNAGRFTRGAATFLLGATYQLDPSPASQQAALAQFEELETLGYALITSGTPASGNNAFRQVFNPSNKNNLESILEFQFNVGLTDPTLRQNLVPDMSPLNSQGGGNAGNEERIPVYGASGNGSYMPTQNHILSYAGADPSQPATPFDVRYEGGYGAFCPGSGVSGRLGVEDVLRTSGDIALRGPNTAYPELNIATVRDPVNRTVRVNCIAYFAKWRWPEHMPQPGRDNNNFIAFRYADALLRRAESLARLGRSGEAIVFVNQVRARAGLPPLAGLSGQALLDAILQERGWELGGEGHRWLDLKRFGKASAIIAGPHGAERAERVSRTPPAAYMRDGSFYRLRFPIRPRDVELSQCRIMQNPGWGAACIGT
jgi:hypothetical protein